MKKIILLAALSLLSLSAVSAMGPMGKGMDGMGQGGMGMGQGMGMYPGMMGGIISVPDKLPAPKDKEWIQKLQEALAIEKKTYLQYSADSSKYSTYMPYMMVIPQEEYHIQLIDKLFTAYGIKPDVKTEQVMDTKNLNDALELSVKIEQDLISRYTWLINKAEDQDSARVLNRILLQSRWHLAMFQHAISMGGHMGPGMMGSGMMQKTGS